MTKNDVAAKTAETLKPAIAQATYDALNKMGPGIGHNSGAIVEQVTKEIAAVVVNQTNQEPWYQSRTTLSQYATVATAVAGLLGYTIAPELREQIIAAVLAVGVLVNPAITLWSRWIAKKPLGS